MKPAKRQTIMDAAEALFSSRRFHEITMEDVARQAGVGKGTIYRYFADKDDLFQQVARSGYDVMLAVIAAAAQSQLPFDEQLAAVTRGIADFVQRRRRLFQMMEAEDRRLVRGRGQDKGKGRHDWLARREQLTQAVADVLARGVASGAVRADLPPKALASCLLALLWRRGPRCGEGSEPLADDQLLDLFLNGVAAGKGGT